MRLHAGLTIAVYQFLGKDDAIAKQAIKYTDRIIDMVKRIPGVSKIKTELE